MLPLKTISNSTLKLSPLVTGNWHINELTSDARSRLFNTAVENGLSSFDTADIYGSYTCEELLGKWLAQNPGKREQMQLISKCGIKLVSPQRSQHWVNHYDSSREHIIQSAERSLKNLGTDRLDLLLIHRPDPLMMPEEVAAAFSQLKRQGKVLHFGVSNFSSSQFSLLSQCCDEPIITNQIEISVFKNEALFNGSLDYLMEKGISPMAWSPVGGKQNIEKLLQQDGVTAMAKKYQLDLGALLLAWLLKHPAGIVPVIGTMNAERVKLSTKVLNVDLDRQDWFELLRLVRGYNVP